MDSQQQFCLKWNSFGSNLATAFGNLYKSESLTDVTLFCEGVTFRAHRVILAACSKHFQELFEGGGGCPPGLLVILDGTSSANLAALLQFMYRGEVHVSQDSLSSFLKAAECLQVKGLSIEHERLTVDHGAQSPHPPAPQHHQHHPPLTHHHHMPPQHAHAPPETSPTTRKQPRLSTSRPGPPSSPPGSPPYDSELMHAPAAPATSNATTPSSTGPPYSVISPFVPQYRPYDRAGNPGSSPANTATLPPPSSSPSSSSSSSTSSPLVTSAHDRKRPRGVPPLQTTSVDHHRPRPLSSPAGDGGNTPPAVPAPAPSPGADGASPGIRASVLRECKTHGASDDKMPMALVSPHRSTPLGSGDGGGGQREERGGSSFSGGTQPRAVSPPFGSSAAASHDQGDRGKNQAAEMDGGGNSCPEDLRIKSEPGVGWLRGVGPMDEAAVKGEGDGGGRHDGGSAQPLHATAGPTSAAAVAAAAAALWNSGGTGGGAKGSHKSGSTATADGKKLKCPFCERLYGYETNLRAHIRQRHQGIRVPCPFCSRTFTRNNTVRRHIAREHKTELSLKAFQQAAAAAVQQQQQQQVGNPGGQQVANHSGGGGGGSNQ
ncbi:zinc finger protein chinmo [Ischnura elegans]|uniref:zinc finger protein chinmo n=1 Tax=Ischnura elegans TaxID=197161 RepID=UPI001ED87045|nr:zinc finger protein chinmo [Ischnura elegans]